MITKERLEELIKQRAKIWGIGKSNNVFCVGLKFRINTLRDTEWYRNKLEVYSNFFETKEDAEEYAEFGNITRTERLDLPNWEEFNKVSSFTFKRKDGSDMEIAIWHNCPDDDCKTIKITRSYDWSACCFEKPLTRENYDDARRLCIKLFKGE